MREGHVGVEGREDLQVAARRLQVIEVAVAGPVVQAEDDPPFRLLAGAAGSSDGVKQSWTVELLARVLARVSGLADHHGAYRQVNSVGESRRGKHRPQRFGAHGLFQLVEDVDWEAGVVVGDAVAHAVDQRVLGSEALDEKLAQVVGRR
jgi:hypothetical protein